MPSTSLWRMNKKFVYITISILTYAPQSRWTRVSPSPQGGCGQTRWSLYWPDRIRSTAWFLKRHKVQPCISCQVIVSSVRPCLSKICTWYLDGTLKAGLDSVDFVVPQHLVQRRSLKESQHHLWPRILWSQSQQRVGLRPSCSQRQHWSLFKHSERTNKSKEDIIWGTDLAWHVNRILKQSLHLIEFLLNVVRLLDFYQPWNTQMQSPETTISG